MSENSLAIRKFSDLANPTRFLALADRVLPWFAALTALFFVLGLWLSFTTEGDYQQGETVRIMYVHVPAAWLSMMCYSVMALAAIGTLVWRHPLADVSSRAAAPIGACFTFLALVTGSLWGKPMWGAWWVWDARLFLLVIGGLPVWSLLRQVPAFQAALRGVNASVVGLLLAALYQPVWTSAIFKAEDFGLAIAAFGLLAFWKTPPWLVVVLAAAGGAALAEV